MNDIKDRLGAFRPAAPPADLRARVIAGAAGATHERRYRVLEWLPAAAAAGVALVFYLLGAHARATVDSRFSDLDRERQAVVDDLASRLGGDEIARQEAERSIEESASEESASPDSRDATGASR